MTGYVWLGSFLVLPACGWPLLSHPAFRELSLVSRTVLSGAVGAVLLSFAMTVAVLVGFPWNVAQLAAAAALLALGLRALVPDFPSPRTESRRLGAPAAAAHLLALLAVLTALLASTAGSTGSPDLIFFWGAKAQHFAMARTIDPELLRNPFHQFMHPYYPPLVTNLYAFASMLAGRFVWTAAILSFPLVLAALALGLPGILRTAVGPSAGAAVSALIVSAIGYLGMEADIGGNGEMPLLLFETLAIGLLLSPAGRAGPGQLLTGLLLAGVATTKVEGLPFVVASTVLFFAIHGLGARTAWKTGLRLVGPSVATLGAWFAFGATRHLFLAYAESGDVALHLDQLGTVARSIGLALFSTGSALPWLVPLACLVAALPLSRRALLPLGVAVALTGFFVFTYILRAENPAQWISWSAARIFSPVAVLLALAATCARETSAAPATHRPGPTPG